ncbi:MAG: Ig-like domain-containing protein [Clostridia bacterium]|nr:Ig-like domain-containing protein [Clostridia bacterium]
MKKSRILSLILAVMLILVMSVTLIACNEECTEHIDENGDLKCDNCEADMGTDDGNGDGGNTDTPANTETYTFTVKDQNGNGVPGVTIEFTVNGKNPVTATTNDNGVATANLAKDAVLVQAEIMDYDNQYIIDDEGPFTYEDTKSFVYDEVIKQNEFVITVVDNAGAPVEGAIIQLCFGDICKQPKTTSKIGKASIFATEDVASAYVSINELPSGYALQNGGKLHVGNIEDYAKYTNFNANNEIQIVVDKLNVVTVTVGDLFGSYIKDIKIDIYNASNDVLVATLVTNEQGKAEFILPVGDYYFKASHNGNDPRYTWVRHEEGLQEIDSNSISTTFVVKSVITYTFNATRSTNKYGFEGVGIKFFNKLFEEVSFLDPNENEVVYANATFDSNGVATVNAPYDAYYAEVYGIESTGHADLITLQKDGKTTYDVAIIDDEIAGTTQNPIVLHYGTNNGHDMQAGDILTFKVFNPNGGKLVIKNANVKVVVGNQEGEVVGDTIQVTLGTEAEEIITIEAKSELYANQWGIEVAVEGTKSKPYALYDDQIMTDGQPIEINLVNGKAYYTFYANSMDATLHLWSNDDVGFYDLAGDPISEKTMAKDDEITFYVVGEGEVTIMVGYSIENINYYVSVSIDEGEIEEEIEVALVYNGDQIRTAVVDGQYAIFEDVQKYPLSLVKAVIKPEKVPTGYSILEGQEDGVFFDLKNHVDGLRYETAINLELIRDGSQNAPYKWHKEGIYGMPTEITATITAGGEVYYDFFGYINEVQVLNYYVYVMGNQKIYMYKDTDADGNINFDTASEGTFDSAKNATWFQVPVGEPVIIKVTSDTATTLTLKCKEGAVPDMSSGEEEEPDAEVH